MLSKQHSYQVIDCILTMLPILHVDSVQLSVFEIARVQQDHVLSLGRVVFHSMGNVVENL